MLRRHWLPAALLTAGPGPAHLRRKPPTPGAVLQRLVRALYLSGGGNDPAPGPAEVGPARGQPDTVAAVQHLLTGMPSRCGCVLLRARRSALAGGAGPAPVRSMVTSSSGSEHRVPSRVRGAHRGGRGHPLGPQPRTDVRSLLALGLATVRGRMAAVLPAWNLPLAAVQRAPQLAGVSPAAAPAADPAPGNGQPLAATHFRLAKGNQRATDGWCRGQPRAEASRRRAGAVPEIRACAQAR